MGLKAIWFIMMTSSNGNLFAHYWSCVRGIRRWPFNSPDKGQWRGSLMCSLICAWTSSWPNNGDSGEHSLWHHCNVCNDFKLTGLNRHVKYLIEKYGSANLSMQFWLSDLCGCSSPLSLVAFVLFCVLHSMAPYSEIVGKSFFYWCSVFVFLYKHE